MSDFLTPGGPHDLLRPQQIMAMLGLSSMTVYRLIHTGQLRAYRIGRSFRVRRDDFEDFMRGADTFASGDAG